MKPTILVLIGITGDLSRRKLLPAIEALGLAHMLPKYFKVVGVSRREGDDVFTMDLSDPHKYQRLKQHLENIEKEWGLAAQRLFYLSVAPTVSLPIIEHLGAAGLAAVPHTKLMLEKPFGLDLKSATSYIDTISRYFTEEQMYRIDHYLAKETVRALAMHPVAIKNVTQVTVRAYEAIGIEGRGDFYEQTGALRDLIQSHLLQVAALSLSPRDRLLALTHLSIPNDNSLTEYISRGQYEGYRDAVGNATSAVETCVSVRLHYDNPESVSTTVLLETGKAFNIKQTDISFSYTDGTSTTFDLTDTTNAYEQVFLDAIAGDKTFFVSAAEILQAWRIIAPIQQAWQQSSADLTFYPVGTTH